MESNYISGVRHVGLVCSNIDTSIVFYESLGFVLENAPLEESGKIAETVVGIKNVVYKTVKMHLANDDITMWRESGFRLELVEYINPKSNLRSDFDNNLIGRVHLCFSIKDLDATVKHAKLHGAHVPFNSTFDVTQKMKYIYIFDPDKNPLELVEKIVD
jgi:catechol 2,3-dioxygenase-like lactoylglutathione lyase family enzyme